MITSKIGFFVLGSLAAACGISLAACSSDSGSDSSIPPAAQGVGGTSSTGGSAGAGGSNAGTGGTTGGAAGTNGGSAGTNGGSAGTNGGAAGTNGGAAGTTGGSGGSTAGTAGTSGSGGASGGGSAGSSGYVDPSVYASALKLSPGLPFGVIGAYTTDRSVQSSGPSWGSHGGPLTGGSSMTGDGVSICRWKLPTDATGAATCEEHDATPTGVPMGAFFGQTIDVPFLGATILSYTGMGAGFPGEVLVYSTDLATLQTRGNVNGYFAGAPLTNGTASAFVFTALSPITTTASATNMGGLYTAPDCMDSIVPNGTTCPAGTQIGTWQAGSSGPVTADVEGTVFASLSTFGGAQEIHAYAKNSLLSSSTIGAGDMVVTDMNYTTSMAAEPNSVTNEEGWLFIAEGDPNTGAALPILAQKYGATTTVTPGAQVPSLITTVPAMGAPALFSDDKGVIWIAIDIDATHGMFIAMKHK